MAKWTVITTAAMVMAVTNNAAPNAERVALVWSTPRKMVTARIRTLRITVNNSGGKCQTIKVIKLLSNCNK